MYICLPVCVCMFVLSSIHRSRFHMKRYPVYLTYISALAFCLAHNLMKD